MAKIYLIIKIVKKSGLRMTKKGHLDGSLYKISFFEKY